MHWRDKWTELLRMHCTNTIWTRQKWWKISIIWTFEFWILDFRKRKLMSICFESCVASCSRVYKNWRKMFSNCFFFSSRYVNKRSNIVLYIFTPRVFCIVNVDLMECHMHSIAQHKHNSTAWQRLLFIESANSE